MRWLPLFLGAARLAVAASTTMVPMTTTEAEDDVAEYTKFNDVSIPPLIELTPDNWEKESKSSKWLMVKHYRYLGRPPSLGLGDPGLVSMRPR